MKVQLLQKCPISGAYHERWYEARGDCTFVLFEDENYQEWIGIFGNGSMVEFSLAIPFSTGNAALVIAGGQGYIVDINSGELKYRTECDYLLGAIAVPERDLVIVCDTSNLYALTGTSQIWQSNFDSYNGFKFEQATPEQLSGHVWYHGDTHSFELNYKNWEFVPGPRTTKEYMRKYKRKKLAEMAKKRPATSSVKHFPGLTRYIKRITISPDGAALLHTTDSQVTVWDTKNWGLSYSVTGSLIGVSTDGKTFLTRHVDKEYIRKDVATLSGAYRKEIGKYNDPPCTFKAWETQSGRELDLGKIAPETYQLHQRTSIFANRLEPTLKVKDLLGDDKSSILPLHYDGLLENWIMTPDDQHIATIYYVSAGGFDTTVGHCVDAATGIAFYEFKVDSSPDSLPEIYFSAEHKLMISNHTGSFTVYDLEIGEDLRYISRCDEAPYRVWGSCFAVNPCDKWQVATSYAQEPYMHWDDDLRQKRQNWRAEEYTNSVVILNIADLSNEGKVERVLKQTDLIDDIEFFPDGDRIAVLLRCGNIHIWNIATGNIIATLSRHN